MNDDLLAEPSHGPILLCAGTDRAAAARLAEAAVSLLCDRPAVVLATWEPPPMIGGYDAVMDALYDTHEEQRAAAHQAAADVARAATDALEAHGLHVTRQVCPEDLSPWREILDRAEEIDASVIVAGIREAGAQHAGGLGRQARALAHRSHRPVLFVPAEHEPAAAGAPAIFACDGSEPAMHAVRAAAKLLRRRPATVASVWQPVSYAVGVALLAVPEGAERLDESARVEAAGHAGEGAALLAAAGWSSEPEALQTTRGVTSAIVGEADERDAAVVVTGSRGRSRLTATLLGSTAEGILRYAGRPVLLVPPAVVDEAPDLRAGGTR
jgi:nucleotide-binding universal stress UspA family protein